MHSICFSTRCPLRSPAFSMAATLRSRSKNVGTVKKSFSPPREVHDRVTHSMPPEKTEIFKALEGWAEKNVLVHLKPVEDSWQPQDFLPDPSSDGFHDQVKEIRERAKEVPDDYFVVLVGDMVTEEALPTYQTMLNTADGGVRDETGASPTPWAVWNRGWSAEENRHGDLLNKYLYLSGRVDMRQIEKTIQYLIGSEMVSFCLLDQGPKHVNDEQTKIFVSHLSENDDSNSPLLYVVYMTQDPRTENNVGFR